MAKITLSDLLKEFENETRKIENQTRQSVFSNGNVQIIDTYRSLVENLFQYVNSIRDVNQFVAGLSEANEVLNRYQTIEKEREQKEIEEIWMSYSDARKYWRQKDIDAGRQPVKERSYFERIKSSINNELLEVKIENGKISVNRKSLDKTINNHKYASPRESRETVASTEETVGISNGEDDWISPQEALQLYQETEFKYFPDSPKNKTSYQRRISYMINHNQLKTREEGKNTKINKTDLISNLQKKYEPSQPTQRVKGTESERFREFVRLINEENLSKTEALEKMGIAGKLKATFSGLYEIHGKRKE